MSAFRMKLALVVGIGLVASGCVRRGHVIPKRDLQELARIEPNERGKRVRVIQNMIFSKELPPASNDPGDSGAVDIHVGVSVGPRGRVRRPRPARRTPRVRTHKPGSRGGGSKGGGSKGGGSSGGGGGGGNGKAMAVVAVIVVVSAGFIAAALAASEGMRFDGWAAVDPDHPIHLYGRDGGHLELPLSELTPELATWTRKAMVREGDGGWRRLERAPLNRRGWNYSLLFGSAEVPVENNENGRGYAAHIQLGHFFTKHVGLLADLGLGWTRNLENEYMTDMRLGAELQVLPFSGGRFHAGGFGQIGHGWRFDDTPAGLEKDARLLSGGALMQIELTTRMALTVRAAATQIFDTWTSDFTAGIAIY